MSLSLYLMGRSQDFIDSVVFDCKECGRKTVRDDKVCQECTDYRLKKVLAGAKKSLQSS
jgi:ribosomal protein L32